MDKIIDRVDEWRGKSIEVEELGSENFIDQVNRMRIIDWELSGMNEPCFEEERLHASRH